jgi:hypothetical protein
MIGGFDALFDIRLFLLRFDQLSSSLVGGLFWLWAE